MGSKSPPFRGGKRRSNRPKNNFNKKGSNNTPSKSIDNIIAPETPQPKSNNDHNHESVTTTPTPRATMTTTSATPMIKNSKSSTKDDTTKPSSSIQGNRTASTSPSDKPTPDDRISDVPHSDMLRSTNKHDQIKSTFLLQKELYEYGDDSSTVSQSNSSHPKFRNSIRMTMMFKIPSKKEGCSDKEAPIVAIQKMNEMLKALSNKLPCRVGPWLDNNLTNGSIQDSDLLTTLPEDIDFVESYIYEYNRFILPGKNGYVRMRIFFSDLTSSSEITSVSAQFKTPRERFFEPSHSDSTSPIHIGCLTGSVKSMTTSQDFYNVFKSKFNLSHLGFWWTQPKSDNSDYDRRKFTLHIEIDRQDLPKREHIERFFHQGKSVKTAFFGTPMILTKPFNYDLDDNTKSSLVTHARKQFSMGKSLQSTVIYGAQLSNWANSSKTSTLLEELMQLTSITEKSIIKGNSTKKFFGRLFHAIIPDQNSKTVEFFFTKANSSEGSSVARALPLFIRDHYKKSPDFFCDSAFIQNVLEGEWSYASRKFYSAEEKEERNRLDEMEDAALAEVEIFVSKDQQKAMAIDEDDVSDETRLTKNDKTPESINGDISEMTGSTRESKAQRYADKAVKDVAVQYTNTISNMQNDIAGKDDKIADLLRQLNAMKSIATTIDPASRPPVNNNATASSNLTIEIDKTSNSTDHLSNNNSSFPDKTALEEENISVSSTSHDPEKDPDLNLHSENNTNEDMSFGSSHHSSTVCGSKRTGEEVESSLARATRARKTTCTNSQSTSNEEVDLEL